MFATETLIWETPKTVAADWINHAVMRMAHRKQVMKIECQTLSPYPSKIVEDVEWFFFVILVSEPNMN